MPRKALDYLDPELRYRVTVPNLLEAPDGTPWENPTQQHLHDATDVNKILARHDRDNVLQIIATNEARAVYGDFTQINEFQEAANLIRSATEAFEALPATLRRRFGNDPGVYMEFCSNPENLPEMRRLGIAEPAPAENASVAPQEASAMPNPPGQPEEI